MIDRTFVHVLKNENRSPNVYEVSRTEHSRYICMCMNQTSFIHAANDFFLI